MTDSEGRDSGHSPGDEIGSVADEAAKLLGALSSWARDHGSDLGEGVAGVASTAASAMHNVNEHIATDSAECRYCPVCRVIHVVRDTKPEVKLHLATAAASLMQAAALVLATAVPDEGKARAARGDDIEHIDLDGDWPDED